MNESGVKQQIVDNIQNVDTILVTVGSNPSVDELSAALGLTMYLNDLGKHATAVMSGAIPPAINFLEPEKTFEPTIDSLRDFVIALDKDKADHLRYKVEGDVVKIFITPYRTVISSKDLEYSQGDYNVEMVIALGVTDQDHLDKALAAHGKIFHDAIVATIGLAPSTLGTIDWVEETASSLSELATSLTGSFQDPEKPMTSQVASALLTGIVAATDRFSNDKTTSQTMSISAVLMAAGANQQLIASKLREGAKLPLQDDGKKRSISKSNDKPAEEQPKRRDGGLSIAHRGSGANETEKNEDDSSQKPKQDTKQRSEKKSATDQSSTAADALDAVLEKTRTNQDSVPQQDAAKLDDPKTAEDMLSEQLAAVTPVVPAPVIAPSADELLGTPAPEVSESKSALDLQGAPDEPSLGGTLNATTEQAAQDKRNADTDRNKTILSHGTGQYVGDSAPTFESPLNGAGQTGEQPSIDPFANLGAAVPTAPVEPLVPPTPTGTLADIDQQSRAATNDVSSQSSAALDAVNAVVNAVPEPAPFDPMAAIAQVAPSPDVPVIPGAPMTPPPPPMPDFSQLPPLPPPPVFPQGDMQPVVSAMSMMEPTMPVAQPLGPQIPELPQAPLPPEQLGSVLPQAPTAPLQEVGPVDPKQFKIPGQQ